MGIKLIFVGLCYGGARPTLDRREICRSGPALFDQLYNFAHWLTQDASEAEDLVQETYRKALRGFSGFQAGTNFRAWIFRILRNAFLNSRSGLKIVPLDPDEEEPILMHLPRKTALVAQANRETVRQALTELAVPLREILLLCEVEEMSYEEIAQVLAIPVGNGDVAAASCPKGTALVSWASFKEARMACENGEGKLDFYVDGELAPPRPGSIDPHP